MPHALIIDDCLQTSQPERRFLPLHVYWHSERILITRLSLADEFFSDWALLRTSGEIALAIAEKIGRGSFDADPLSSAHFISTQHKDDQIH